MPPRKAKTLLTEAVSDLASDTAKSPLSREKAAQAAFEAKLKSKFKRMSTGSRSDVREVISTGVEVLDKYVLGCGGWPAGRIVELFSEPGAGKTSLAFSGLAESQRAGGLALLAESENALQVSRATVFGVNLEEVFLSEPLTLEEAVDAWREGLSAIPEGVGPNLFVHDSLAMSQIADIVDRGTSGKGVGRKAKIMSEQLPAITRMCASTRTCFMLINQSREKIGIAFGDPTTTPGGQAHKFASSLRIQMWPGAKAKVGERVVGISTTVGVKKSKVGIPHRKAKLRLLFDKGWDDMWATINVAKDLKLLPAAARVSSATHEEARKLLGWDSSWVPGAPIPEPPKPKKGRKAEADEETNDLDQAEDEIEF